MCYMYTQYILYSFIHFSKVPNTFYNAPFVMVIHIEMHSLYSFRYIVNASLFIHIQNWTDTKIQKCIEIYFNDSVIGVIV